jgi:hypothetical protein
LKDFGSAEKDVLLEMALGELLFQIILGDGLLDLRDCLTSHD